MGGSSKWDGRFGTWAWDVAFSPSEVRTILEKHNKSSISNKVEVNCPACGKTANSRDEVEKIFGFRNMDGIIRPQSWCRDCRKIRNMT